MHQPRATRRCLGALGAAAMLCMAPAQATTVSLNADGQWNAFNVSDIDSQSFGVEWIDNANSLSPGFGSPLLFNFSIGAGYRGLLTVVDAGFAGDTFHVTNLGAWLGDTSAVPVHDYASAPDAGTHFDAALGQPQFSRAVFTLGAGSYSIGGALAQSVLADGLPLNATVGALRLTIEPASPVPEPSTTLSFVAGLGLFAFGALRRSHR